MLVEVCLLCEIGYSGFCSGVFMVVSYGFFGYMIGCSMMGGFCLLVFVYCDLNIYNCVNNMIGNIICFIFQCVSCLSSCSCFGYGSGSSCLSCFYGG